MRIKLLGFVIMTASLGAVVTAIQGVANAQAYCYYDQGYYVKRGCYAIATNEYGQIIQVCCR